LSFHVFLRRGGASGQSCNAVDQSSVPMCHCAFDSKLVRLCRCAFDQSSIPICHCAFDIFPHGALDVSAIEGSIACDTLFCDCRDLAAFAADEPSAVRVSD
jgi:hypothetical protein